MEEEEAEWAFGHCSMLLLWEGNVGNCLWREMREKKNGG
jgi:hypothetical protein